jgi:hypothetical protein
MRKKLILGLAAIVIAGGTFVSGVLVERYCPGMFGLFSNVPNLVGPADRAGLKDDDPEMWEFSWSKVPRAERYYIYIAHSTLIDHPVVSQEVDVTFFRTQFRPSSVELRKGWTWKVRAMVGSEWSNWSEVRTFDVEPKGG